MKLAALYVWWFVRGVFEFIVWVPVTYWWLVRHCDRTKISFIETVEGSSHIVRGRAGLRNGDTLYVLLTESPGAVIRYYSDRGRTWCFGWDGQEADALDSLRRLSP